MPDTRKHSKFEDCLALLVGTLLCSVGLVFLDQADLLVGQTAGAALLLSYLTPWSFGVIFFVINIPFYVLAQMQLGWNFVIRSAIAVSLISLWTELSPLVMDLRVLHAAAGAAIGGTCAGLGLLAIFRHGGSVGGIGVLALWTQSRLGWRAGWVQLGFDCVLFSVAVFLMPFDKLVWSVVGAVMFNLIVALNHREDRYLAR